MPHFDIVGFFAAVMIVGALAGALLGWLTPLSFWWILWGALIAPVVVVAMIIISWISGGKLM